MVAWGLRHFHPLSPVLLVAVQIFARASNQEREMFTFEKGISRAIASSWSAIVYVAAFLILHQSLKKFDKALV